MKILILGDDFQTPHGVVNYTYPLASRFVQSGLEVHYFYSGSVFLAYDLLFLPRLKRSRQRGIHFYKIINSPIYAQFPGSPEADLHNSTIEKMLSAVLDRVKPDIVYIDSLLGLPSRCLAITGARNIPTVFTHHVYRLFCQYGVFHDHEGNFCGGPLDHQHCALCFKLVNPDKHILTAKLNSNAAMSVLLNRFMFPPYRFFRNRILSRRVDQRNDRLNQKEISGLRAESPDLRARLEARLKKNTEFLNRYVDVHLCVSSDVKRNLIRFGIEPEKLRVQHIGSLAAERSRPKQHPLNPNEIVIGNIGGVHPYKGTHVLIHALKLLRDRTNWKVLLHGRALDTYQRELNGIFDDSRIRYTGPYRFEDIDSIIDGLDITVLPSICNDTAPQTIFESFSGSVPILASNIGGFPDFIRDGVNGLLFEPGNPRDLSIKIDKMLKTPQRIEEMIKNISPQKTLQENVDELLVLFEELMRNKGKPCQDLV